MSILVCYANFYVKNLRKNNDKLTQFHWSRKSRDSCPTSSEQHLSISKNYSTQYRGHYGDQERQLVFRRFLMGPPEGSRGRNILLIFNIFFGDLV